MVLDPLFDTDSDKDLNIHCGLLDILVNLGAKGIHHNDLRFDIVDHISKNILSKLRVDGSIFL